MFLEAALAMVQGVTAGKGPRIRDPNEGRLLGRVQAPAPKSSRAVPTATVEVTDGNSAEIRDFVHWIAPSLRAAAAQGEASRESVQALAEFMAQDPTRPHPPTPRSTWYNALQPSSQPSPFRPK